MNNKYKWEIVEVIDGDTVRLKADFLPYPLKPFLKLRLHKIDAPEIFSYKCEYEKIQGLKAKEFVKKQIEFAKNIEVTGQADVEY